MTAKPKLAVWKFSSCDGCQLTLLDCEDELLAIADAVEIAYFLEMTRNRQDGPYDVSLVEGSISTPHEMEQIHYVRAQSKVLVTIGACATAGGIQALRNTRDHGELKAAVYARPEYIDALDTASPIAAHVPVDHELRGCPIDKRQLIDTLMALLTGRDPKPVHTSQCVECKLQGTACVMVTKGIPCLGPVTSAGCGNLCPSVGRGCYGCFGPSEGPNTQGLAAEFKALGIEDKVIHDLFAGFTCAAPAFAEEIKRHDG